MNPGDVIPILLLLLLGVAIGGATAIVWLARRTRRKDLRETSGDDSLLHFSEMPALRPGLVNRPAAWLAIRCRQISAVQSALSLTNPTPCTWAEGVGGEKRLFIAPPVNGWILVTGSGLPDPADDPDASFRFLLGLSRKLGHVQYFSANRVLNHHAWVRAEAGRIVRAYAWADRTVWNQGVKSRAELELGLKCLQYFETPERALFGAPEILASNTERVPALAAKWSLDPASIDERVMDHSVGIAGEPTQLY